MTPCYDKREVYCQKCHNTWILTSNFRIKAELYILWLNKVWIEHYEMFGEHYGEK